MVLHLMAGLRRAMAGVAREESGQGLSEYALILVFIAIVAIVALIFLGSDISQILSQIATSL